MLTPKKRKFFKVQVGDQWSQTTCPPPTSLGILTDWGLSCHKVNNVNRLTNINNVNNVKITNNVNSVYSFNNNERNFEVLSKVICKFLVPVWASQTNPGWSRNLFCKQRWISEEPAVTGYDCRHIANWHVTLLENSELHKVCPTRS